MNQLLLFSTETHSSSALLDFSKHELQYVALATMAVVYTLRILWFLSFKAAGERQAPTGRLDTTRAKGVLYSWANVAMPWAMESTRSKWFLYAQFVVFHLGVTAAIALSFIIPEFPGLLTPGVVLLMQVVIGAAFVVGILRIIRRVGSPYMRAISSPDDYFSLVLLTVWFLSAVVAAPNDTSQGEWHLLAFFLLTAFFLIYVPFSKISHYLYYPFTRYYLGKTMGYRGVYPMQRQ
jgi:nitrate reductase gamma subunit